MPRKVIGINDHIMSPSPVQSVTWRNWQQYVDRDLLRQAIQQRIDDELNVFDGALTLNLGNRWIPHIPRIATLLIEFIPTNMVCYVTSQEPGANYDSYTAQELIDDWENMNPSQRILYMLKAWYAIHHCEPAFARTGDSYLSIAGLIAICYILEVPTT